MDESLHSSGPQDSPIVEFFRVRQTAWLQFIQQNQISFVMFIFFVFMAVRQFRNKMKEAQKAGANRTWCDAPGFPEIEQLESFKWQDEAPIKLRTFKPKFYLTMDFSDESAIQNLDPSELLLFDSNYEDRLKYRKRIIMENPDTAICIADEKRIRPAIIELYTYLLATYLPKRFPELFKLHFTTFSTGSQFMFENRVTNEIYPTVPTQVTTTYSMLRTLGKVIDEDFLFLLPEDDSEDPKYILEALVCVCPSGWDPKEKIGKRLATIHKPVPGYKDKLEGSMDRYFKSLEVGKYVKRSNWAITQHRELWLPDPGTNHSKEGEEVKQLKEINPDETFLRTERQTLHRLPKSKAIVFAFKTYLDSLRDIKLEGLGDDLADAIDGLRTSNVPEMNVYKRGAVWGEAAKEFLRS